MTAADGGALYVLACAVVVAALGMRRWEARGTLEPVLGYLGAASPLLVTGAVFLLLAGCAPFADGLSSALEEAPTADEGRADAQAQADYRRRVRAAVARADSAYRAEHALAVAPVPAEKVAALAENMRIDLDAPAAGTAPAPLTVVGWAALYDLKLVPAGVALAWWQWTAPPDGAPVARYVFEVEGTTPGLRMPVAVLEADTPTVRVRVAGQTEEAVQGPFSLWGYWAPAAARGAGRMAPLGEATVRRTDEELQGVAP